MANSQVFSFGASFYVAEDPQAVTDAVDQAVATQTGSTPPWITLTAMDQSTYPYTPSESLKVRVRADHVHAIIDPQT